MGTKVQFGDRVTSKMISFHHDKHFFDWPRAEFDKNCIFEFIFYFFINGFFGKGTIKLNKNTMMENYFIVLGQEKVGRPKRRRSYI